MSTGANRQSPWYKVAAPGEYQLPDYNVIVKVDAQTVAAVVARFNVEAAAPNFAGLLVDFDGGSLDPDKTSAAAGWVMDLRDQGGILEAKISFTAMGADALEGKSYKYIAPWFDLRGAKTDGDRQQNGNTCRVMRPTRLDRLFLTNQVKKNGAQLILNRQGHTSAGHDSVVSKELTASRILNRALSMMRVSKISFSTAWSSAKRELQDSNLDR